MLHRVPTFTATVYAGLWDEKQEIEYDINVPFNLCREYCDKVGLCVTISETRFVYTRGTEKGCIIGLINYPRFPSDKEKITEHALNIAYRLKNEMNQKRISVVTSDETYMIGELND